MPTKEAVYSIDEFKAAPDATSGEFTALVSVFNNVDLVGDRVMPGSFAKSLDRWRAKGDPIPVIWSHDAQNPYAHIGYVTSATETPRGLQIVGKNDVTKNPFAAQVHQLLVDRRVTNWSFRYDVLDEKRAKDGANELLELDLTEVGPTLKGANPETQTINAKALEEAAERAEAVLDEEKAGRRISKSTEAELTAIHEHITSGLDRMKTLIGTATADDGKTAPDATDVEEHEVDDREPEAKSVDDELLAMKTRIASMRASHGSRT